INVDMRHFRLYQNPKKPAEFRVVGTLKFTHEVKKTAIKKHLKLTMRPSDKSIRTRPVTVGYSLKMDRHGRMAYVTSKPVTLPPHTNYLTATVSRGLRAAVGHSATGESHDEVVRIPAVSSYFHVDSLRSRI